MGGRMVQDLWKFQLSQALRCTALRDLSLFQGLRAWTVAPEFLTYSVASESQNIPLRLPTNYFALTEYLHRCGNIFLRFPYSGSQDPEYHSPALRGKAYRIVELKLRV